MLKRITVIVLALIMMLSLVSCVAEEPQGSPTVTDGNTSPSPTHDGEYTEEPGNTEDIEATDPPQGDPVPTFEEAWPAEMLPSDFPNLGNVTKVTDSRTFGHNITIYWNILSKEEAEAIVDKLNEYLDYDHAWQDYFWSDGLKYKPGTQEELLRVEIRYSPTSSGSIEDFQYQFYIEISGDGLVPKE
ncbi:MAG: hypothetical protein GX802_06600 [Clostridiales bacterium]|jgi:hypothetical protein|nr:hypothetical protein [Clostridiales bacterium]